MQSHDIYNPEITPPQAARTCREIIEGARQSKIYKDHPGTSINFPQSSGDEEPKILYLEEQPPNVYRTMPEQVLRAAAEAENWYVPPYKLSFWRRLKRLIGL